MNPFSSKYRKAPLCSRAWLAGLVLILLYAVAMFFLASQVADVQMEEDAGKSSGEPVPVEVEEPHKESDR